MAKTSPSLLTRTLLPQTSAVLLTRNTPWLANRTVSAATWTTLAELPLRKTVTCDLLTLVPRLVLGSRQQPFVGAKVVEAQLGQKKAALPLPFSGLPGLFALAIDAANGAVAVTLFVGACAVGAVVLLGAAVVCAIAENVCRRNGRTFSAVEATDRAVKTAWALSFGASHWLVAQVQCVAQAPLVAVELGLSGLNQVVYRKHRLAAMPDAPTIGGSFAPFWPTLQQAPYLTEFRRLRVSLTEKVQASIVPERAALQQLSAKLDAASPLESPQACAKEFAKIMALPFLSAKSVRQVGQPSSVTSDYLQASADFLQGCVRWLAHTGDNLPPEGMRHLVQLEAFYLTCKQARCSAPAPVGAAIEDVQRPAGKPEEASSDAPGVKLSAQTRRWFARIGKQAERRAEKDVLNLQRVNQAFGELEKIRRSTL